MTAPAARYWYDTITTQETTSVSAPIVRLALP